MAEGEHEPVHSRPFEDLEGHQQDLQIGSGPRRKVLDAHLPERRRAESPARPADDLAAVEEPLRLPGQTGDGGPRRQRGEVGPEGEQVPSLGETVAGTLRPASPAAGEDFRVVEERQQDLLVAPAAKHPGGGLLDPPAAAGRVPHVGEGARRRAKQGIGGLHRRTSFLCSGKPESWLPPDRRFRGRWSSRRGKRPGGGRRPRTAADGS